MAVVRISSEHLAGHPIPWIPEAFRVDGDLEIGLKSSVENQLF
jgi:hypothetical protein